jgi:3-polyprenyl-4-hydroxybenzoate decarboxylase
VTPLLPFLIQSLVPIYVARYFFMVRFYLMPWLLRYSVMGEMIEIEEEVDWNLEEGAILRRAYEKCLPGPIFNKVKDCPEGFRAACFGNAKSGTPEGKWTNWSTNRASIMDKNTMAGLWIPRSQHNGMIHQMWSDEAKDMPFKKTYPIPLKEKVIANMKRWGFE